MTKKIILIEDDPLLTKMYRKKFEQEGFAVETALSGAGGLEKIKDFRPDLVLLEVVKEIDELKKFFIEIKADPETKNTRIIILANLPISQLDQVNAKNLGALDILQKADFTPEKMAEKIKAFLEE